MGLTLTSPSAQSVRRTRQCLLVGTDPIDAVSYKVYVRLTTGNEAGSEPVIVIRSL